MGGLDRQDTIDDAVVGDEAAVGSPAVAAIAEAGEKLADESDASASDPVPTADAPGGAEEPAVTPGSDVPMQPPEGEGACVGQTAAPDTMGSLLEDMGSTCRAFHRDEVIEGTIVGVDKDGGLLVDIGSKSEGVISSNEVIRYNSESGGQLAEGDTVVACVVQTENAEGHVVLSLARARSERGWRQADKLHQSNEVIEAQVVDHNTGGLIVDIFGVRGFVPISQITGLRQNATGEDDLDSRLAAMRGRTIALKVLEINRRRNRLILSERSAAQEMRASRKEQLLGELRSGELRDGRISSVCDFGAFVDLGGADGLIHISEISWDPVNHPGELLKVGDEVQVYVLNVDREKKKIALSLRRSQPEPWTTVPDRYHVGDLVPVTITKLAAFGAFARLQPGVEGLIHISELSDGHVTHPSKIVREGQTVRVRILRVEPERRRLALSLRQAGEQELTEPIEEQYVNAVELPEAGVMARALTGAGAVDSVPENVAPILPPELLVSHEQPELLVAPADQPQVLLASGEVEPAPDPLPSADGE